MRFFERSAVVAVAVMTAPAFPIFPALGLWYVAKVWPDMSQIDRSLFLIALVIFCLYVPYSFNSGLKRIRQDRFDGLEPLEIGLLVVPMILGGWALLHRIETLIFISALGAWDMYRAARKKPSLLSQGQNPTDHDLTSEDRKSQADNVFRRP